MTSTTTKAVPERQAMSIKSLGQLVTVLERADHLLAIAGGYLSPNAQAQALQSRLASGMFNLAQQLLVLNDSVLGAAALLTGVTCALEEPSVQWVFNRGDEVSLGATDETIARVRLRLTAALQKVRGYQEEVASGRELHIGPEIVVVRPGNVRRFEYDDFVWRYVLPNG